VNCCSVTLLFLSGQYGLLLILSVSLLQRSFTIHPSDDDDGDFVTVYTSTIVNQQQS